MDTDKHGLGYQGSAAQGRQDGARKLVVLMWPLRHDFAGARVTLRSFLRLARRQRGV